MRVRLHTTAGRLLDAALLLALCIGWIGAVALTLALFASWVAMAALPVVLAWVVVR